MPKLETVAEMAAILAASNDNAQNRKAEEFARAAIELYNAVEQQLEAE